MAKRWDGQTGVALDIIAAKQATERMPSAAEVRAFAIQGSLFRGVRRFAFPFQEAALAEIVAYEDCSIHSTTEAKVRASISRSCEFVPPPPSTLPKIKRVLLLLGDFPG